jgi:hypothetical protein
MDRSPEAEPAEIGTFWGSLLQFNAASLPLTRPGCVVGLTLYYGIGLKIERR